MVAMRPASITPSAAAASDELASRRSGGSAGGTPHPAQVKVTTQDVLQHVADHPGVSAGLDLGALRRIWAALVAVLSEALGDGRQQRGVQLPNFATFTLRRIRLDKGTWGLQTRLKPAFCLLPAFCQRHSIINHRRHTVQLTQQCSAPVTAVSMVGLAQRATVSKDAAANVLKDIWRAVGDLSQKGATFCMDFGVARVVFHAHRYEVFWSGGLARVDGAPRAPSSAHPSPRNAAAAISAAAAAAAGFDPAPSPSGDAFYAAPPAAAPPPDARSVAGSEPSFAGGAAAASPAAPRAVGELVGVLPSRGEAPPLRIGADGRVVDRHADGDAVSSLRSRLSQAIDSARAGEMPGGAPARADGPSFYSPSPSQRSVPRPQTASAVRSGGGAELDLNLLGQTASERYQAHRRHKTLFRRHRARGHVSVWDEQRMERQRRAQAEADEERDLAEKVREAIEHEEQRDRQKRLDRRAHAQQIDRLNRHLAKARRRGTATSLRVPGPVEHEQGDLEPVPDIATLKEQIHALEEKIAQHGQAPAAAPPGHTAPPRPEHPPDEEKVVADGLRKLKDSMRQLAKVEAEERRVIKAAMAGSGQSAVTLPAGVLAPGADASHAPRKEGTIDVTVPSAAATAPPGPPSHPASLPIDDHDERQARRTAAKAVMELNKTQTELAMKQHKKDMLRKRSRGRRHHEKFLREFEAERLESVNQRRGEQRAMRQAWATQTGELEDRRRKAREDWLRRPPPPKQWRNESSGDEDS